MVTDSVAMQPPLAATKTFRPKTGRWRLDLLLRVPLGLPLDVPLEQDPQPDPLVRLTAQVRAAVNTVCRAATDPPTGSLPIGKPVAYA